MSHDASYKLLFSHREMVTDLLRGFLPAEWVAALDFGSLERLSGNYVGDKLQQRYSDLVWRVRWGPNWLYVVILIEFQSTEDPLMASRIGAYVNLLHQDLVQTGRVLKGAKLPPVLPIVLYNGPKRWTAATELAELIEPVPAGLEPYQPQIRYLLIDEGRYSDETLSRLERNLVAALFRLEKGWPPSVLLDVLTALLDWLRDPAQESLQRAFTEWLKRVWAKPRLAKMSEADWSRANSLLEVRDMLAERINEWSEELFQRGLQQGERQILTRLARSRFGQADADALGALLEAVDDPEQLAVIGEWLVKSADGKTFLARVETLVKNR